MTAPQNAIADKAFPITLDADVSLRYYFSPADETLFGEGSETAHFLPGDQMPIDLWDGLMGNGGNKRGRAKCGGPLLWYRIVRRWSTESFPEQSFTRCKAQRALTLELGITRCAFLEDSPTLADLTELAEIGRDDSWRLDLAACGLVARATELDHAVDGVYESVEPWGPEGGVVSQSVLVHFQLP